MHASLTYFSRDTRNLIDFQSCFVVAPPMPECTARAVAGGYYINLGRTRVNGVEAEIAGNITDTLSVSLDYTNLDSKDETTGLELNRRPRNTGSAILNWTPQSNWGLGASVDYVGEQIDQYDTSTVPVTAFPNASHTVVNLFGHYDFEHWGLYGRIENLFDKHYEPLIGYGAPGRAFFVGVKVNN